MATDTSGNTTTGSFKVTVNFAISGRITSGPSGPGIAGVSIELFGPTGGDPLKSARSGTDGRYSIVVSPGSYIAFFNRAYDIPYSREWWNHQPESPDTIVVAGSVGGIDAALTPGVFVHGRVTDEVSHAGIDHVFAAATDPTGPCCRVIAGRGTDADGNYTFVVPAGTTIKVQFTTAHSYLNEWWDNKRNFETATPLTVIGELVKVCPLVGLLMLTVGAVVSGALYVTVTEGMDE